MPTPAKDVLDRISDKIGVGDGCWEWRGHLHQGYGRLQIRRHWHFAHRLVYETMVGPIPDGQHLDHLCRNRRCVKPSHLEPVTGAQNQQRGANARLDWDTVRYIRSVYVPHSRTYGTRSLARRFHVSCEAVSRVARNEAWVEDPALEGGQ